MTFGYLNHPLYEEEVAFYSDLYVTRSLEAIPGVEGALHLGGFYIVGWKDGRVEQVPVADVRVYPHGDRLMLVFPGMSVYDTSLPVPNDPKLQAKIDIFKKSNR